MKNIAIPTPPAKGVARTYALSTRLSLTERRTLELAASLAGFEHLSQFVRSTMLSAASQAMKAA